MAAFGARTTGRRQTKHTVGKRFWALAAKEKQALRVMFHGDSVQGLLRAMQSRAVDDKVELIDAAYWVKGCSSLGRLRYAALLRLGRGEESSLCLVDVKEGTAA